MDETDRNLLDTKKEADEQIASVITFDDIRKNKKTQNASITPDIPDPSSENNKLISSNNKKTQKNKVTVGDVAHIASSDGIDVD